MLSLLLRFANCPEEAEHLFGRHWGYEPSFGPDHPELAVVLCNVAGLLRSTNRLDEVERLYRRAVKIVENSFGPGHPKVATRFNNLAVYLKQGGRGSQPSQCTGARLEIRHKSYSPVCKFSTDGRFTRAGPTMPVASQRIPGANSPYHKQMSARNPQTGLRDTD